MGTRPPSHPLNDTQFPTKKQPFHSVSFIKQPSYTKSFKSKGAQFREGVTAIHVAPEVDVITDCDVLRTAQGAEKESESGLARTRLGKASGWLGVHLLLRAQLGRRFRKRRGQGQDVGCRTQSRESCTSEVFHMSYPAQVGLEKNVIALVLKAASKSTSSTYIHHAAPTYP